MGSMEAGFGLEQHHLSVIANPNFFDGVYGNHRTAQTFHAIGKTIDSGTVYRLENKKVARANEMPTPNPRPHFLFCLGRQHGLSFCRVRNLI